MSIVFDEGEITANGPTVAGETVGGESIMFHRGKGHYFSAAGSGAVIWEAVQAGTTVETLVLRLVELYDVTPANARAAVTDFLRLLASHDLIVVDRQSSKAHARETFVAPVLEVHTELEDVLLLDPIHDVAEDGWPVPAAKGGDPSAA